MTKIKMGLLLLAISFSFQASSQKLETQQFSADFYVGGPNLLSRGLKIAFEISDIDVNVTSTPLVGVRVTKMWQDNVSLGLDVNYRTTEIDFREHLLDSIVYDYKIKVPQIRVSLRAEYHLESELENLDIYFPALLGYKNSRVSIETNDPHYKLPKGFPEFTPFSVRLGVGMRYFFVENIGFNAEIGVGGGAFFQTGLSLRL